MRAAYVALYALWPLIALGIFFEGMFEFSEFGRTDSAIPLWTCAALMALAWVLALKAFTISTADRWDRPSNPVPDLLPPASAYLEPFVHLCLLICMGVTYSRLTTPRSEHHSRKRLTARSYVSRVPGLRTLSASKYS